MGTIAHRERARAFTLIELMAVVAIVSVLALVGLVGYRRFITSARTTEAVQMVGSIRAAEESFRAETLTYLDVSGGHNLATPFPAEHPGKFKTAWPTPAVSGCTGDTLCGRWMQLGAKPDAPVVYGYAVAAGGVSDALPVPAIANPPAWPAITEPWYVILATGDIDGDGTNSHVLGSSFTGEIYVENEGE
jgi:prepilin-type N-terminal cleavage/methylation domain-containing protein